MDEKKEKIENLLDKKDLGVLSQILKEVTIKGGDSEYMFELITKVKKMKGGSIIKIGGKEVEL